MSNVKLISLTQGSGEFKKKSAEDIIVYTARVSSPREDKFADASKLLAYCIRNGHWSIFETASMTVEITTSMPISKQLLRHRSFTFQEFSARYSDSTQHEELFQPIELRKQAKTNRQSSEEVFDPQIEIYDYFGGLVPGCSHKASELIKGLLNQSKELYQLLLDLDVSKECARFVLPQATTTKMYMTGNVRSWIHFLQSRDSEHAQKEIQLIAKEIKFIFIHQFPNISKSLNYI